MMGLSAGRGARAALFVRLRTAGDGLTAPGGVEV